MQRNGSFVDFPRLISRKYFWYMLLGLIVFVFSFYVHLPASHGLNEFSDLQSLFSQIYSHEDRWFKGTIKTVGIPYLDYRFEYPPIVAAIFYSASLVSYFTEWMHVPRLVIFYGILALLFLLPAYVVYFKSTSEISEMLHAPSSRLLFAIAGFGMAYYVVYNFDIIAIAFAMLSLLLLTKGRVRSAGFLLGLSVASKVITGIIIFPSLAYLAPKNSQIGRFLLGFSLSITVTFGPVYAFASRGFLDLLGWHTGWYCENCFYAAFVSDIFDITWKWVSLGLMILVPLAVMWKNKNSDKTKALISRSLVMVPTAISVSYIYSPQMNVMIAPAYLLAIGFLPFAILASSDFLNMLIMPLFFRADKLCALLGVTPCPRSWKLVYLMLRIGLLWLFIAVITIRNRSKGMTD